MKARLEAAILRLAARLLDRNVERAKVISRKDNNYVFEVTYELRKIADRIERNYDT